MSLGHLKKIYWATVYDGSIAHYSVKFSQIPTERKNVCFLVCPQSVITKRSSYWPSVGDSNLPLMVSTGKCSSQGWWASGVLDMYERERTKMVTQKNGTKVSGISRFYSWSWFCIGVFCLFLIASTSQKATACPGHVLCFSECRPLALAFKMQICLW